MDPSSSVCRLHPGVAVTGFCPACLRDRLAGLQPPSSAADLRRCKSFSYARSAAAASQSHSQLEPQRRSCDLFHRQPIIAVAVPEEEDVQRKSSSSFGGLLGKKLLQQWRRKKKVPTEPEMQEDVVVDSSCDLGSAASCSWNTNAPRSAAMTMEEEDYYMVPRSDGQIPVEEDNYYYDYSTAVPGGCAQTREYYLDSSSSSRRRRSSSGRNSFSDVINNGELPTTTNNANARVSPAIASEFYHHSHQSVLVHHQYRRDYNDFGSFGSAFQANKEGNKPNNNSKKGIKGWSIWGLIHKKRSTRKPEADHHRSSSAAAAAGVGDQVEYPWPELRARGYNGQMLRCNSSISARSSFTGGAAMLGGSARRSISGMELQHADAHSSSGRMTRDELLLSERNLTTTRSSYSRSSGYIDHHPMGGAANYQFISRPNHTGGRSSKSKPSALPLPRRSTLGPYSTDLIPRQY
ncbi:hypothetical protein PR202_ga31620 [Eleusine coracana subsp. coracana]|uniref:Uncharacterized protein n=1 Tax=Eleusine coracana subsp. coracana TaxID=191504 RepID=A0AAV5DSC7_ELECO|nr:hypothetical protein QOZ80_9AG0693420 [Eleusine coracana subsp. coracana]GJN13267.1 hypothetical protein PR202_ga31620 [Eleusine coracana subsp. coracana]